MKEKISKVFVAMSGGVDSSVAALLLKKQGYDCVGVFMRCWGRNGPSAGSGQAPSTGSGQAPSAELSASCAERDAEDARRVAEHIGIPFYAFDFEEEYKKRVVEYMVEGYRTGITPNPDVMCNREIKFGLFLEKALSLGADYVATGHYVKLITGNGKRVTGKEDDNSLPITHYSLHIASDTNKDQSYFLWTLNQSQLRHCLFPVGDYLKSEVREIARKAGLPTAEKKDSQGICFLGNVLLMDFLKQYLPEREGVVLTTEGKKIGEHEGAHFYTIGQRHGFLVQRVKGKGQGVEPTKPHYVVEKDVATNTVVVAEGSENPALYKKEIMLADVHFINPFYQLKAQSSKLPVLARVRYRQPLAEAILSKLKANSYKLTFDVPQKFIAPGQSAVFYAATERNLPAGRQVLGGGIIVKQLITNN